MTDQRASIPRNKVLTSTVVLITIVCTIFPNISQAARSPEWQQQVNYQMDLKLFENLRAIGGDARITYQNNSPDTLASLWFRLAPAALQGGSVVDTTQMRSRLLHWSAQNPQTWGNLQVAEARCEDGYEVEFVQDYSIGQLLIDPPLLPGDSITFTLPFTTTFPSGGSQSRMGYTHGQYKGAYWYPQICPYTPEFGWTVNRYFGTGEAFGEFGDYTINYTVPYRYIIASTGELVNESEVLPPERMAGLAIDNPNPIPIPDGATGDSLVTWIYQANNVPDVAFAMDPKFLIDRVDFGHFEAWSFSRRGQEDDWSDAAEVVGWTISELEKIYGRYPWPRVAASYSWSAMEYPMLTMMGWGSPQYVQVMIHEVVHNYTPMILHSNSVDEQWIDEGFTTFLEHHLLTKYEGTVYNKYRTYTRGLFSQEMIVRDDDVRGKRPYLEAVLAGEDLPMVRGGDIADDYPLLRVSSYYKTPVMLNTLRSVIGEDAFWRGFRIMYDRHALTHVSGDDIVSSFEDASGRSLKWFFDQFLYGDEDLDYAIEDVDFEKTFCDQIVSLNIRRIGGIRLPLSLGIVTEAGDTLRGVVPFLPTDPVPDGAAVWGTWDQWHMPNDRIHLEIELPAGQKPVAVIIDPDDLWTDREPQNNRWPVNRADVRFDPVILPVELPPLDRWQLNISPTLGYSRIAPLMAGVALRGSYLERENVFLMDVLVPIEEDYEFLPQFRVGYATQLNRTNGPVYATIYGGSMHNDMWVETGLYRSWRSWTHFYERAKISLKLGTWARDEEIPGASLFPSGMHELYSQNDDDYQSMGYLRAQAEFSGHMGRSPFKHQFKLTVSQSNDFSCATWSFSTNKALPRGWDLGFESRVSINSGDDTQRFMDTPGSASPYEMLGNPLFGGAWGSSFNDQTRMYTTFPRVHAPAALASDLGTLNTDRFLVLRLAQTHRLPGFMRSTKQVQIDRFLNKIRLGVFESGLVYNGARADYSWNTLAAEAGVEASVVDLYGLTLSARVAPLYSYDILNTNWYQPQEWNTQDWLDHIVIYVKLNLDPYFR